MTLSRTAVYLIVFAAVNGLIAVITGSLAAHGIENIAPKGEEAISWFSDGSDFQMKLAFAIILVALLHDRVQEGRPRTLLLTSACLFASGIIFFSGSLYAVSFNGPAMLAPVGGLSAMIGFIVLVFAAISAGARSLERSGSTPGHSGRIHPEAAE